VRRDAISLFTGGGCADLGMIAAGWRPVWGVEKSPEIAAVAMMNGIPVEVGDVLGINYNELPPCELLHASPPCPNFSVAKHGTETALDIALASKVADIVVTLRPKYFTLENVPGYAKSESFQNIIRRIAKAGYWFRWQTLNSADFGVPQTRRRLWLIAHRDGFVPALPQPVPWVGWYAAIADLVPSLPDSQFAPWQLERFPAMWRSSLLVDSHNSGQEWGKKYSDESEPSLTVTRDHAPRAFIVDDQNNGAERDNGKRGLTVRNSDAPVFTVSATQTKRSLRAAVPGRVVAMTPRCMARFQSFPDSYELPDNNALACRIIGNAVPPLLAQRIYEVLQ
jgi:DNA (cytosine-5)-methyltransferase 1